MTRLGAAAFFLFTGLWSFQGAAASEIKSDQHTDQDKDLDLIPSAGRPVPTATDSTAAATPGGRGRIYVEDAVSASFERGDLIVPSPPPFDWQERLFLDVRHEWSVAESVGFVYSGRVNFRAENDIDFPTHENVINDFREGYLAWRPGDRTYIDIGRINLKSGVALGYNPTDFFRRRSLVEPLSADPSVLREDRLGTLMMRAQRIFAGGSMTLAVAPKVANPSPIYTNLNLPSFDPMFDRTNANTRILVKGTVNLADNFNPELLALRDGDETKLGASFAMGLGQKVVAYLEWSGGRTRDLVEQAWQFGKGTGTLPLDAQSPIPEISRKSFQNELAVGASYATESRITFNIEYHFSEASFTRSDWNAWFAAGRSVSSVWPTFSELWYLRGYAQDRQEPISRNTVFLRADWVDAFISKLELTAFVNADAGDGSGLLQTTADYYLSDYWTVGCLFAINYGPRRSDFGSLPQAANVLFKVARYF
jgi:hypothetical protein